MSNFPPVHTFVRIYDVIPWRSVAQLVPQEEERWQQQQQQRQPAHSLLFSSLNSRSAQLNTQLNWVPRIITKRFFFFRFSFLSFSPLLPFQSAELACCNVMYIPNTEENGISWNLNRLGRKTDRQTIHNGIYIYEQTDTKQLVRQTYLRMDLSAAYLVSRRVVLTNSVASLVDPTHKAYVKKTFRETGRKENCPAKKSFTFNSSPELKRSELQCELNECVH